MTDRLSVQDLVAADVIERKQIGLQNYGRLLYPNNGRSMLRDAYEEALDLACYLKCLLEEESGGSCD